MKRTPDRRGDMSKTKKKLAVFFGMVVKDGVVPYHTPTNTRTICNEKPKKEEDGFHWFLFT
jgi:hypothetical protein